MTSLTRTLRQNSEHEELTRQIKEANDQRLRDDLERELDELVARMDAKSSQITKLKRFHDKVCDFCFWSSVLNIMFPLCCAEILPYFSVFNISYINKLIIATCF